MRFSLRKPVTVLIIALLTMSSTVTVFGRASVDAERQKSLFGQTTACTPAINIAAHRVGRIVLSVTNRGVFGNGFTGGVDQFTGETVPSCIYPKGSGQEYLFAAAFWIGAVVGRDTLVSEGANGWSGNQEFTPECQYEDPRLDGRMKRRSIIDPSNTEEFTGAISEEDFIASYTDTLTDNVDTDFFGRGFRPLNIKVTERSFAWSYEYAEDFILFDYEITNLGFRSLEDVYMGVYVDADVGGGQEPHTDDLCGFVKVLPTTQSECEFIDTVNLAYIMDNDGDPGESTGIYDGTSVPDVTATRIVRTPAEKLEVSFNWWVSNQTANLDFGPRHRGGVNGRPFRDLKTSGGVGTPEGDVNKYDFLRNGENDYDQAFTSTISDADTMWMKPPEVLGGLVSKGFDTRYLLSFGPFTVNPGDRLPISLAYLAGEGFHTDHNSYANTLELGDPASYYENLDFTDLGLNARWASWIYDNPGVDTDGDGYFGEYRYCNTDSVFVETLWDTSGTTYVLDFEYTVIETLAYIGDGVPDFVGASPPPAPGQWSTLPTLQNGFNRNPALRVFPREGGMTIRFNGYLSETTRDNFSGKFDFEGYRVYIGRDERASSFSVVASYDIEDYNKWVLLPNGNDWKLKDVPYTIDQLDAAYGGVYALDPEPFDPLFYSRTNRFVVGDSTFFFEKQDYNASGLGGASDPISKRFPDEPAPTDSFLAAFNDPDVDFVDTDNQVTDDGFIKYFEYEFDIDNLLRTVSYFVNVTAFDYGSPSSGLPSLESAVTIGAVQTWAKNTPAEVAEHGLQAYVYPNPYRGADGGYAESGFESPGSRDREVSPERLRRVNFANLPQRCQIRIYSLDGDLVREIDHNYASSTDPLASQDQWDLITRNTQAAVSGIYFWTVENLDTGETQIGRLALIM